MKSHPTRGLQIHCERDIVLDVMLVPNLRFVPDLRRGGLRSRSHGIMARLPTAPPLSSFEVHRDSWQLFPVIFDSHSKEIVAENPGKRIHRGQPFHQDTNKATVFLVEILHVAQMRLGAKSGLPQVA